MTAPIIRVIVSVDTEEDSWAPIKTGITTANTRALPELERFFGTLGVRASYFTNYHVAIQPESAAVIRAIHESGRAEIAAHLHPWNTPPFLDRPETMLLNLPEHVQAAKLDSVTQALTAAIGTRPKAFRAGRFGFGPSTARALIGAGYTIDSSVTPFVSWERHDGGPSHVGAPLQMYRLDGHGDVRVPTNGPLVEVPLSSGYNRWHPGIWPRLHSVLHSPAAKKFGLYGLAARTEMARSVILSPEVHGASSLHGLASSLIRGGVPYLHMFWHSPSMIPGLSPFCRTPADVRELLARVERLFELLARKVSLRFVTISEAVSELAPSPAIGSTSFRLPEEPTAGLSPPREQNVVYQAPADTQRPPESSELSAASMTSDVDPAPEAVTAPPPSVPSGASTGRMGRHTMMYLLGIVATRAMSFLMLPFYTRFLTTEDYGVMQLLEMTLDIIAIVAGARIAAGVHRYYFKATTDTERRAVLSTAATIVGVSFIAFGGITYVLAEPLTQLVLGTAEHANLMRIAAVTFALQSCLIVPLAIIQLQKRSALYSSISTSRIFLQQCLNILFLAGFGWGVESVFISTLIATTLQAAVLTVMVLRRVGLGVSRPAARALLAYGLPLVGTQFASFFVTFGDRYFLRVSADVATVGLYSLAYQFGFIVTAVGFVPFSMAWEPTRFQLANRPDRNALYSRAFLFMNLCLLVPTVGAALFVRDFIVIMSGPAFHSAYKVVPVILAAYVFQAWANFHEVGILVKERTGYVTLATWTAALVALIAYAVLIPLWLSWGAAVATLLAFVTRWIVTYRVSERLLPVQYEWAPVLRLLALSTVFVLIGVALPHPNVPASIAMRAIVFAGYLWSLWHISVLRPDEKTSILAIFRSPTTAFRNFVKA